MTRRFLIEVSHEGTVVACARAADVLLKTGSHFLSHTDWGCKDGEHKAWIVVEVDSKDEARLIVPPVLRPQAKIVQLNTWAMDEVEDMLHYHKA